MSVAIVTDSTAYLPGSDITDLGISVVNLQVVIDSVAISENVERTNEHVFLAVRAGKEVTTSRPNPAEFEQVYAQLAANGAREILSIHVSSELSGTYESARIAATRARVPVTVVDSRTIAMAMGFAVQRAALMAQRGFSAAQIAAIVRQDCAKSQICFYVDTLEFLRRGGRISSVATTFGNALNVRPILEVKDGKIQSRERVRTRTKAVDVLVGVVLDAQRAGACDVAVHHVSDELAAYALVERLESECGLTRVPVTECGAVIATHVGPGACAVVVSPQISS